MSVKKIGITGGIGSGKSVVTGLLRIMEIPVYIADDESKRLTVSSPVIRTKLIESFGEDLFEQGELNKSMLASLIFGNEQNLKLVNSIIHPVVLEDFFSWVQSQSGCPVVAIETAILFESGFGRFVDVKVNVSAPLELRIDRALKRDSATREAILARISNQLPDEENSRLSDYVIVNDGFHALIPQVENLLNIIYS